MEFMFVKPSHPNKAKPRLRSLIGFAGLGLAVYGLNWECQKLKIDPAIYTAQLLAAESGFNHLSADAATSGKWVGKNLQVQASTIGKTADGVATLLGATCNPAHQCAVRIRIEQADTQNMVVTLPVRPDAKLAPQLADNSPARGWMIQTPSVQ